jgi:hypothetical protein
MNALMAPGIALMKLFPNKYKMPICSALYLLPLALLYYEVGIAAPAWLTFLIIGLVLFAMYAMAGWYFQAAGGWEGLHRVIQRTSEGDFISARSWTSSTPCARS